MTRSCSVFDNVNDDNVEHGSDESDIDESHGTISHALALDMFDKCLQWLHEQEEANSYTVRTLLELREMAARKRISAIKQKKISDYFNPTPCTSTDYIMDTADY